ncbi:GbsR/MarR family transcriptional regulator [Paenibacillus thailandensis]|uniref:HTH-type transcriptional regulator n=1 Tax=Paenibacillus thailandensis TaxID=393250 RepID=A0ABW5QXH2_9BACL
MNDLDGLTPEVLNKINHNRERVIDSIGKNMDLYGITLSVGHLYGYMYFSEKPVTLDDLSQKTGMSKTSMSTGVRTLMDLKMIDKVWGKGSRKDLYEAAPDWHQNFCDYFSIKWRKAVESNMAVLAKALGEIGEMRTLYGDDEQVVRVLDHDERKITEALHYYKWLSKFIEAMESGKIFELIPKER